MKRTVVSLVVMGLLAGALVAPVDAKKRKKPKKTKRVVSGTYANPAIGVPGVAGTSSAGGAVEFPVLPKERFISVNVEDDSGQPVVATMSQNTDTSDDSWEIFATICGETEKPIPIARGITVRISVYTTPGPEQPTCTGPASSGKINATFTNR